MAQRTREDGKSSCPRCMPMFIFLAVIQLHNGRTSGQVKFLGVQHFHNSITYKHMQKQKPLMMSLSDKHTANH